MNTRNLQIHLENKLSSLATACIEHSAEDDGLIFEILSADTLNDASRLEYICQIECRLPAAHRKIRKTEVDLNSLYPEEDESRTKNQQRWNQLHKIAVELSTGSREIRDIPRERFYELVSVLGPDSRRNI